VEQGKDDIMRRGVRAISLAAVLCVAACQSQEALTRKAILESCPAALEKAKQLGNDGNKTFAYWMIARAQAKAGDVTEARKNIDKAKAATAKVSDDGEKTNAYRFIIYAQAKAGDAAEAKETVALIEKRERKVYFYLVIASEQAERGNLAGAMESVADAGEMRGWELTGVFPREFLMLNR